MESEVRICPQYPLLFVKTVMKSLISERLAIIITCTVYTNNTIIDRLQCLNGLSSRLLHSLSVLNKAIYNECNTIIFQASSLKFSHDDHNKSSISMKLAYQTQTKHYNDQSHLVCVEHGFVVNN